MSGFKRHLLSGVSLLLLLLPIAAEGSRGAARLAGRVVDTTGQAVPGATIIVLEAGTVLTGAATNNSGRFSLSFPRTESAALKIRVSSVGFEQKVLETSDLSDNRSLVIVLTPAVVEVEGMIISPSNTSQPRRIDIASRRIGERAQKSLIATNPTAAIKEPEVTRAGSSLSSQLRVHGTNPVYYLNGLPIGTDPAHYGMFCFIPASVVRQIKFQALGSSAKYRLPSVVEFESPSPFDRKVSGDVNLSTIDLTGTMSFGGKRWYALGSLRKSVLDRLVKKLQGSSDRTTLPPTNFQDVFASVGFDLGHNVRVMVDQYHVRDYLRYNTSVVTKAANGTITTQESSEDLVGLRLQAVLGQVFLRATGGMINERHQYHASPETTPETGPSLYVDLHEYRKTGYTGLELDINLDRTLLQMGIQSENKLRGKFDLEQRNWNFLPPFANTDNPFVYQQALNETCSELTDDLRGWNHGAYFSVSETADRLTIEGGVRLDVYTRLAGGGEYSYRLKAGYRTGKRTTVELFHGTFSESPVDDILEPYQALIRTNLERLRPIKTELWSAGIAGGSFRIGVFNKLITGLPVPTPDFEQPLAESGSVSEDFIVMTSTGKARFWGGAVSIDRSHFLIRRLYLYASYAYTRAHQVDNGIETRYVLEAPHKALVQADYRLTAALSAGAEMQVRSGFPYSPLRAGYARDESALYTESYYRQVLSEENSRRFPTHAYLNLNAAYSFGRTDLFLSISNVTNRANPIINASTGLIYDAGITPMLGMKVSF